MGEWRWRAAHAKPRHLMGMWPDSRFGRFIRQNTAFCTHWLGGSVNPRVSMDTMVERKTVYPSRKQKYGHTAHSQSLYWLSYSILNAVNSSNGGRYSSVGIRTNLWDRRLRSRGSIPGGGDGKLFFSSRKCPHSPVQRITGGKGAGAWYCSSTLIYC